MRNTRKKEKDRPKMKKIIYERELPASILDSLTKEQYYQYQIWDGIVKRLAFLHPRLVMPLIKEIFHKEYPENVNIEFLTVEYTLDDLHKNKRRKLRSLRADIVMQVDDKDIYHFECQIRPDSEMVIRMYEYDTQIALRFGFRHSNDEKEDIIAFPQSVIMYLTHTSNTPDKEVQRILFPNGESSNYTVPVMKIQNYSLDMIWEKKLYYLLPLSMHRFYEYRNHRCDIKLLTAHVKESMLIINEAVRNGDLTESEGNDIMGYVVYSIENMTIEEEEELRENIFSTVPYSLKLPWEKVEDLEEQKEEGIEEFIVFMKSENKSVEECIQKLQKIFFLSDEQAKEKIAMYW